MSKLNDFQLFENVLIYLARIEHYNKDLTQSFQNKDFKTQDAILYCIQQFGNCISDISDGFKKRNSQIDILQWHIYSGFANDEYFSEDDLFEVIDSLLLNLDKIETIYLKERQKPENSNFALIPAKAFENSKDAPLPLKKGANNNLQFDSLKDKKRGFNPRKIGRAHV